MTPDHPRSHRRPLPRSAFSVLVLLTSLPWWPSLCAEDAWPNDYEAAIAAAKKSGRVILANFTGSDWCYWCRKLKQEVFDTEEFKRWAGEHVYLLEIDFPKSKAQDPGLQAQNQALMEKHHIQGFPTILILTPEGEKMGELGYMRGGPQVWIDELNRQYAAERAKK